MSVLGKGRDLLARLIDWKIVWKFSGDARDEWTPPCAVKRLNGWQEMMEGRVINGKRGVRITVGFLEHLAKAPSPPDEDE